MARYDDRGSMGRSRRAPFIPGETPSERHDRRLRVALGMREAFERWLAAHDLALRVANDGHHWQIRRGRELLVEWWPSSAKAVIAKRYDKGVHCHDADQLRELIARRALRAEAGAAQEEGQRP